MKKALARPAQQTSSGLGVAPPVERSSSSRPQQGPQGSWWSPRYGPVLAFSCLTSHSLPSFLPVPQTHRRNVGDEYVTENHIFAPFFSTGKGGNGHTHSTPQHRAPNYPPMYYSCTTRVPRSTPNYPKLKLKLRVIWYCKLKLPRITTNYHKLQRITTNYPKIKL